MKTTYMLNLIILKKKFILINIFFYRFSLDNKFKSKIKKKGQKETP